MSTGVLGGPSPPPFAVPSAATSSIAVTVASSTVPNTVYAGGQPGAVREDDEELRPVGVLAGVGHRQHPGGVGLLAGELVVEGVAGSAAPGPAGVTALEDEDAAGDQAVAGGAVEVPLLGQGLERVGRAGRVLRVQGEREVSDAGLQCHRDLTLGGRGARRRIDLLAGWHAGVGVLAVDRRSLPGAARRRLVVAARGQGQGEQERSGDGEQAGRHAGDRRRGVSRSGHGPRPATPRARRPRHRPTRPTACRPG